MRKNNLRLLRVFGLCFASFTASCPQISHSASTTATDYDKLRTQILEFQGIIENTVAQNIKATFPILSSPKGIYLEDYGAVFSLEASLYQIRAISPFSPKPHSHKELDNAYQALLVRVDVLKQSMLRAIAENGTALQQLKPTDNLAVVVHLFNGYNDPDRPYPSQLIMKTKMDSLSQYRQRKLTLEQLSQKVQITHF